MNLKLKKTQNYNTWYYPVCDRSKLLFKLMNRKALKQKEVDMLIEIGFNIEGVE